MSNREHPKYARLEHERRFLVDPAAEWRSRAPFARRIEDWYLVGRLRLRRMTDRETGGVVLKLSKKYAGPPPSLVTTLLSEEEFAALRALDGRPLAKTRHYVNEAGRVVGVDVFEGACAGLVLAEVEVNSEEELRAVAPPTFARREVTGDLFFTGGNLCQVTADELAAKVRSDLAGKACR